MVDRWSQKFPPRIDNTFPIQTILLILFFLSGVCGLMYEVVWSRMLTLVMGNTVFATTIASNEWIRVHAATPKVN